MNVTLTKLFAHCITSEGYWKEQLLASHQDLSFVTKELELPYKSYYFEKLLESALAQVDWNINAIPFLEKLYLKHCARYIQAFTFSSPSLSLETAKTVLEWLPNLKILTLYQANQLLQQIGCEDLHLKLHTLKIIDVHLLDKRALAFVPATIAEIHIDQTRSVASDFLQALHDRKDLSKLSITSSALDPESFHAIPKSVHSLDLSNSGKNLQAHVLELLPQGLKIFVCNGWNQCSDCETAYLPPTIHSLELNGWQLSKKGLETICRLPLTHLSLRFCSIEALGNFPKTLHELDLSGNQLTVQELNGLRKLSQLKKLTLEFMSLNETIGFTTSLQELSLSNCGQLSADTIHNLTPLTNLETLRLCGCCIDNHDLSWLPLQLKILDLSGCSSITDTGAQLLDRLKILHTLILDGCEQIRGFGLASLSDSIKKLSCQGCHRLSGKSLVNMPKCLEELYLDQCELIEEADIQNISQNLQVLSLRKINK